MTTSFSEYFDDYSPVYELMFSAAWSDWEESGWMFIFAKDGKLFILEGGDSPTGSSSKLSMNDLCELSQDEALAAMLEWAEDENTHDFELIELCTAPQQGLYAVYGPGGWYAHRERPEQSAGPCITAHEALKGVGWHP